jgi:DNA polymerase-3 subunit delta'
MPNPIIGHEAILRELRQLAAGTPPAYAILFAGPESTGRVPLARYYAAALNCESGDAREAGPCGACRACRLIGEGAHPDVAVLGPGDGFCKPRSGDASHAAHPDSRDIRICQVRGVIEAAARFPFEARYRVVILDPAEGMTEQAGNALLKTLEEPPAHSVFTLISAAPEEVLETIVSRCRRVDVNVVPRAEIEAGLVARGFAPGTAAEAALAARGRPGLALTYAAKPDLMGDRGRLLERCARIAASPLGERFRYTGELDDRWKRRDRQTVYRELQIWEEFWEEDLRQAARGGAEHAAREAAAALRTVSRAREYLSANCLARSVLDFMVSSFPGRTLAEAPQGTAAPS